MTIAHLAVVVPAADEQDTIVACLDGLDAARHRLPGGVTVDVVVVLDGCRDATAERVRGRAHTVVSDARRVGVARRLGSLAALDRAGVPAEQVWTAHTDADSVVPPHWLLAQLEHAGPGLVLGTVQPELAAPELNRWHEGYDDRDGHRHVHGANLGIRGDVLLRLGGWPSRSCDEDVELVRRATRHGMPVARVGGMAVRTSARPTGRARVAFSGYLLAERLASGEPA